MYFLAIEEKVWSGRRDSNPRPQPWQGCALPLSYTRAPSALRRARPLICPKSIHIARGSRSLHAARATARCGHLPATGYTRRLSRDATAATPPAESAIVARPVPQPLLAHLDALGIAHRDRRAPAAVHGRQNRRRCAARSRAAHTKNLFLKDKKGRLFLVTAEDETRDRPQARCTRRSARRAASPSARPSCCASCSASSPAR